MRGLAAVLAVTVMVGCTSIRMAQKDGCWVRQTEKFPGRITEEIGPCTRPPPTWVNDRLTRLVQECVAQADFRWQNRAIALWNRGEPVPERESDDAVLTACMAETARAQALENETLARRLDEVSTDRTTLQAELATDRAHLRDSNDKIAAFLGEAAKKASPPAVATASATSDGRAKSENGSSSHTTSSSIPVAKPAALTCQPNTITAPRPRPTTVAAPATNRVECELKPVMEAAAPTPLNEGVGGAGTAGTPTPTGTSSAAPAQK